jgi:hypothetical protein
MLEVVAAILLLAFAVAFMPLLMLHAARVLG